LGENYANHPFIGFAVAGHGDGRCGGRSKSNGSMLGHADDHRGHRMKFLHVASTLVVLCLAPHAWAEEPDHAIHEELRGLMREVVTAINTGQYDRMLPVLTENIEATSITQEVMSSRADVSKYFKEWFGPAGYMRQMEMKLDADKLTELSSDKSWGLVRGKALEHYEAKDGDLFDFATRWTAVMVRDTDGKWRLRAIHFGTNNLDNPVLTKVKNTLIRNGAVGAALCLLVGLLVGWWIGRRRTNAPAAA
jgi:ketosteroid isomerase-like protein